MALVDSAPPLLSIDRDDRLWCHGSAWIRRNPLTGNWFVYGQRGQHAPYIQANQQDARNLARTVDHWNRTGEVVVFNVDDSIPSWLQ